MAELNYLKILQFNQKRNACKGGAKESIVAEKISIKKNLSILHKSNKMDILEINKISPMEGSGV